MEEKVIYQFTEEGLSNFCNDHKVPMVFQDIGPNGTGEQKLPAFNIYCYEKDADKIEDMLYWSKPIYAYHKIHKVKINKKIGDYSQLGLIKLLNKNNR